MSSYKLRSVPKSREEIAKEAAAGAFRSNEAEAESAAFEALRTLGPWQTVADVRAFMEGYGLEATPTFEGAQSALESLHRKGRAIYFLGKWAAK